MSQEADTSSNRNASPLQHFIVENAAALSIVALTLLLGTLTSNWEDVARGLAILLLVVAVSAVVSGATTALLISGKLSRLSSAIRELDPSDRLAAELAGLDLQTAEQLATLERLTDCQHIWIVTDTVRLDISTASDGFRKAVLHNTRFRDVNYTYILPEAISRLDVRMMQQGIPEKRLDIVFLEAQRWSQLPYTDGVVIVYNPLGLADASPLTAYFEFPSRDQVAFARVDQQVALDWVDRIARVCGISV